MTNYFGRNDEGMYPEKIVEYPDQVVVFKREPRWGLWYVQFQEGGAIPDALEGRYSDYNKIKAKVDYYLAHRIKKESPAVRYDKRHAEKRSHPDQQ